MSKLFNSGLLFWNYLKSYNCSSASLVSSWSGDFYWERSQSESGIKLQSVYKNISVMSGKLLKTIALNVDQTQGVIFVKGGSRCIGMSEWALFLSHSIFNVWRACHFRSAFHTVLFRVLGRETYIQFSMFLSHKLSLLIFCIFLWWHFGLLLWRLCFPKDPKIKSKMFHKFHK